MYKFQKVSQISFSEDCWPSGPKKVKNKKLNLNFNEACVVLIYLISEDTQTSDP